MQLRKPIRWGIWLSLLGSTFVQADGQIGIDYFSGQSIATTVTGFEEVPVDGWGMSLGFGLTDNLNWSIYRNLQEGEELVSDQIGPLRLNSVSTTDSNSWGAGLSYFGETFWISLRYSRSDADIQLIGPRSLAGRGSVVILPGLAVDFLESQTTQSLGLEIGRDWLLGNWSPSLSLGLHAQNSEISRREHLGRVNFTQIQIVDEELSGTDLSLSTSLLYYHQLSERVTLAPSIGLFHQSQLSGEVSGLSQFGLRTSNGSRRQSSSYREALEANSQTSLDAGINLLIGDWILNGTYVTTLSSEDAGNSILLGISHSF